MATESMKINIIIKGEHILVGIQATDCDPIITPIQGTLANALERMPELVEEAKQRWQTNPHYPKTTVPEPTPVAVAPAGRTAAKPAPQQRFF